MNARAADVGVKYSIGEAARVSSATSRRNCAVVTKTIDQILHDMERGLADVHTAEALRDLTDDLFECPVCRRLCETLHGRCQVCSICYLKEIAQRCSLRETV